MGKQDKQYKGAQREMNDYEKNRLSRIQENQARLRDLGVKSIANSLTSLVESQNPKKKKVKTKYTSASAARDSDYNPGLDGLPADIEQYGFQDNVNEVGIVRYEDNVDPNDEFEDMDHVTFENEMEMDDSDDDLESDDDILFEEQLEGPQLEKGTVISTSKKRGPTMLHDVHTRNAKQREVIICNEYGQPVGPVTENDVVGKFSRFLGTIAHTHSYAPLTCASWHKVPHKDKIWEYVLGKYDVPDAAKTWVLKTIGHSYKVYKCRFKKKHFYQFNDNKTRWKNKPKCIPEQDFSTLLRSWNKKDVAKRCLRAKEIRMSLKNIRTAGPKSFARIRDEMKNEDPNHEFPTLTQMFKRTRKRTDGRVYVDPYDDTARKLEQMKNYKPQEDESDVVDPYMIVMNKENDGYRRLYGRGVTNRLIKESGWWRYILYDRGGTYGIIQIK
ncbi:hypothetical protein LXL04_011774 [Taraxacum kok-saghyz]